MTATAAVRQLDRLWPPGHAVDLAITVYRPAVPDAWPPGLSAHRDRLARLGGSVTLSVRHLTLTISAAIR